MNQSFLEWYLNREVEVLLEEKASIGGKEYFLGHTKEYVKAALPLEGIQTPDLGNQIIKARAKSLLGKDMLSLVPGCQQNG